MRDVSLPRRLHALGFPLVRLAVGVKAAHEPGWSSADPPFEGWDELANRPGVRDWVEERHGNVGLRSGPAPRLADRHPVMKYAYWLDLDWGHLDSLDSHTGVRAAYEAVVAFARARALLLVRSVSGDDGYGALFVGSEPYSTATKLLEARGVDLVAFYGVGSTGAGNQKVIPPSRIIPELLDTDEQRARLKRTEYEVVLDALDDEGRWADQNAALTELAAWFNLRASSRTPAPDGRTLEPIGLPTAEEAEVLQRLEEEPLGRAHVEVLRRLRAVGHQHGRGHAETRWALSAPLALTNGDPEVLLDLLGYPKDDRCREARGRRLVNQARENPHPFGAARLRRVPLYADLGDDYFRDPPWVPNPACPCSCPDGFGARPYHVARAYFLWCAHWHDRMGGGGEEPREITPDDVQGTLRELYGCPQHGGRWETVRVKNGANNAPETRVIRIERSSGRFRFVLAPLPDAPVGEVRGDRARGILREIEGTDTQPPPSDANPEPAEPIATDLAVAYEDVFHPDWSYGVHRRFRHSATGRPTHVYTPIRVSGWADPRSNRERALRLLRDRKLHLTAMAGRTVHAFVARGLPVKGRRDRGPRGVARRLGDRLRKVAVDRWAVAIPEAGGTMAVPLFLFDECDRTAVERFAAVANGILGDIFGMEVVRDHPFRHDGKIRLPTPEEVEPHVGWIHPKSHEYPTWDSSWQENPTLISVRDFFLSRLAVPKLEDAGRFRMGVRTVGKWSGSVGSFFERAYISKDYDVPDAELDLDEPGAEERVELMRQEHRQMHSAFLARNPGPEDLHIQACDDCDTYALSRGIVRPIRSELTEEEWGSSRARGGVIEYGTGGDPGSWDWDPPDR